MTAPSPLPPLQFGDVCLYSHKGFFDTLIRLKTWSRITHVEIYESEGFSLASRNNKGVNRYPFDPTVFEVRRPKRMAFDRAAAWTWFKSVQGYPYGFKVLLDFYGFPIPKTYTGIICSQFADLFLQHCGCDCFPERYSAGKISPRDFDITPELTDLWCADEKWNT